MTDAPHPPLCIGCGKDHRQHDRDGEGDDCGYARQVTWHGYGGRERWAQVRLFPVAAGMAAAAIATYFLVRPPDNPLYFYMGVAIPGLIALVVGGAGVRALIIELRKRRYRAISTDGRDRALVVMVGGELDYAFGESLKYEPVLVDVEAARTLSSVAALALGNELAADLDRDLLSWLRRDSGDDALLRNPDTPAARLAIVTAVSVLGLAARGRISLFIGRYKAWGRGGGKMPKVTTGFEVAFEARPEVSQSAEPAFEQQMLELASPAEASPTPMDALFDAIADGRTAEAFLEALEKGCGDRPDDEALASARAAWRRVREEEPELVMRLLQHVLPERPRTITTKD